MAYPRLEASVNRTLEAIRKLADPATETMLEGKRVAFVTRRRGQSFHERVADSFDGFHPITIAEHAVRLAQAGLIEKRGRGPGSLYRWVCLDGEFTLENQPPES